jgi:hypothetical protein
MEDIMAISKLLRRGRSEAGKARSALLLWLLGVPLPIILLIWLIKGCA